MPVLYAPERHRGICERIYKNIGIDVRWRSPKRRAPRKGARQYAPLETDVSNTLLSARICVDEYGINTVEDVRHTLRELCRRRIETVGLYLDLRDPLTAVHVKDFEDMGFFFSGLFPSGARQNLILQYLNNISIEYNEICTVSAFSKELLSYVKRCQSE